MGFSLSISKIEAVFLNSILSEIINYFGVLSSMNERFSALISKTTETAKEYSSTSI